MVQADPDSLTWRTRSKSMPTFFRQRLRGVFKISTLSRAETFLHTAACDVLGLPRGQMHKVGSGKTCACVQCTQIPLDRKSTSKSRNGMSPACLPDRSQARPRQAWPCRTTRHRKPGKCCHIERYEQRGTERASLGKIYRLTSRPRTLEYQSIRFIARQLTCFRLHIWWSP